nr:hypothetical protein [Tanacetum cinerariifolium]
MLPDSYSAASHFGGVTSPLRRNRIAQSSVLPTVVDEPTSLLRDVSQGEACPIDSGFIADQERATIDKSSSLSHDSAPRITSPVVDEGMMWFSLLVQFLPLPLWSLPREEEKARKSWWSLKLQRSRKFKSR